MFGKRLFGLLGALMMMALVLAGCGQKSTPVAAPTQETPAQAIETPSVLQSPVQAPASTGQSPIATPAVEQPILSGCPDGCFDPTPDCLIKGVVTGTGEKLYYLSEMPGYQDALLLVKYGGRWFCTEEEAAYKGFQKAAQ